MLKETVYQCILRHGNKVAFIPKQNSVAARLSISGNVERSASAVWIFIMDSHQRDVDQHTVAVLLVYDWQVEPFFSVTFWVFFLHILEK